MFTTARFSLLLTVASLLTALFFLGNIRYSVNPISRFFYREYFIARAKTCDCIAPSIYYEFRDRYADDTFTVHPENMTKSIPFVTIKNAHITSADEIVSPSPAHLADVPGQVLIKNATSQMIRKKTGTIFVEFYAPMEELHTVHGFAQHFGIPKTIEPNMRWHSTMIIQ